MIEAIRHQSAFWYYTDEDKQQLAIDLDTLLLNQMILIYNLVQTKYRYRFSFTSNTFLFFLYFTVQALFSVKQT